MEHHQLLNQLIALKGQENWDLCVKHEVDWWKRKGNYPPIGEKGESGHLCKTWGRLAKEYGREKEITFVKWAKKGNYPPTEEKGESGHLCKTWGREQGRGSSPLSDGTKAPDLRFFFMWQMCSNEQTSPSYLMPFSCATIRRIVQQWTKKVTDIHAVKFTRTPYLFVCELDLLQA